MDIRPFLVFSYINSGLKPIDVNPEPLKDVPNLIEISGQGHVMGFSGIPENENAWIKLRDLRAFDQDTNYCFEICSLDLKRGVSLS